MIILAIDPGNIESGYAIITMPGFKILDFGKIDNDELFNLLQIYRHNGWSKIADGFKIDKFVIEDIVSYGMAVGRDVFDTCKWIGQFTAILKLQYQEVNYIYRKDEKMCLCGSMKAKDTNIRQALINRYAKFDFKNGKGKKRNPDTFYGVSKDIWQAIAVGVTYYEKIIEPEE